MAFVIPADVKQALRQVKPQNGTDFKLPELYELLDCKTIERYPVTPECLMVLDKEGKQRERPRNERATIFADCITPVQLVALLLQAYEEGVEVLQTSQHRTYTTTDYIAGDVLICMSREVEEIGVCEA